MTYEYEQYLAHHGIKGQKWGHRRYQNDDGSLTDEGRQHYGVGDGDGRTKSPEQLAAEKEARTKKTKKILAIAGGVALGAALLYARSTKLRNDYKRLFDRASRLGGNAMTNDRYRDISRSMNRRKALAMRGKELGSKASSSINKAAQNIFDANERRKKRNLNKIYDKAWRMAR